MLRNSVSSCMLSFFGVPKDKVEGVKPFLMETLSNLVNGKTPFDLKMIHDMINNLILKEERDLEASPHPVITDMIIADLLYGQDYDYVS